MFFRKLFAATLLMAAASASVAETWPSKPIRFVVAAPGGSSLDVIARTISDKLKDRIGQPIVIENIPGGAGTIATGNVARAAPDGHTWLMSYNGPLAYTQFLTRLPYDPQKDLVPVIQTSSQPNVLATSSDVPVKTVSELISYARQRPGRLNYASVGNGSSSHLTMELFKTMTNSFIVHIPYNGAPPAALSLMTGETQILFSVPSVIMPEIKTGKIKALAVTSPTRFSLLPELPTVAEAGLPGFESITWNGVLVPKGTPTEIVQRLNADIDAILKQADVKARFNNAGLETSGGSADAFRALIAAEAKKWEPIIRRTGAKID